MGGLLHVRRRRRVSSSSARPTAAWRAPWSSERRRRRPRHRDSDATATPTRRPPRRRRRRRRARGSRRVTEVGTPAYWWQDASNADTARQQRDDHGRRAGHVRVSDRQQPPQRGVRRCGAGVVSAHEGLPGRVARHQRRAADAGSFGNGWGPGWEGYCTFPNVGTYTLICQVHASDMRGTIIVEPAATPTPTPTRDAHADAASGAGDDHHRRSDGRDERDRTVVHVHVIDRGLDVRVQVRHAGRHWDVRGVHVAAGLHDDGKRRVHLLGQSHQWRDSGPKSGDEIVHRRYRST